MIAFDFLSHSPVDIVSISWETKLSRMLCVSYNLKLVVSENGARKI